MQRKDYALAEETMKNFAQKYPAIPGRGFAILAGESYFQRQQYRDSAETFLGVTTKFDNPPRRRTRCCGSASRWLR
jgi:TolA-binding protein